MVTHLGVCGSSSLNQVLATLPDAAGLPVFDATPGNPIERATLDALAQTLAEG